MWILRAVVPELWGHLWPSSLFGEVWLGRGWPVCAWPGRSRWNMLVICTACVSWLPPASLFQLITVIQIGSHTWTHHGNTAPHSDDISSILRPGVWHQMTDSLESPTGTALGLQLSELLFKGIQTPCTFWKTPQHALFGDLWYLACLLLSFCLLSSLFWLSLRY